MFVLAACHAAVRVGGLKRRDKIGLAAGLSVIVLGVASAVVWQSVHDPIGLPPRATAPAIPELHMMEQPGLWEQQGEVEYPEQNKTARFTSSDTVYWALDGRALMIESHYETDQGGGDGELMVKTYNNATGKYLQTLFTDRGRVVAFEGEWSETERAMSWQPFYPTNNVPQMTVVLGELMIAPDRKRIRTQYRHFAAVRKEVRVESRRLGDGPSPDAWESGTPAHEALSVLGQAGLWLEQQTFKIGEEEVKTLIRGRTRWAQNGRCLVFEGVVVESDLGDAGAPLMWIKSFDHDLKLFRYAYFWDSGAVDHYIGGWNPTNKKLTWRSMHAGAGEEFSHSLEETVEQPGVRRWKFKTREYGKVVAEGEGVNRLQVTDP